jgi:hypothetical protein
VVRALACSRQRQSISFASKLARPDFLLLIFFSIG